MKYLLKHFSFLNSQLSTPSGFTLVELLLVMAIAGILIGITTINLFHTQNATSVQTAEESLISDIKSQQTKAMTGAGGGGSFGVHFDSSTTYTLFQGLTYVSGASTNFPVTIDAINFSCSACTGGDIVFSPINGETTQSTITVSRGGGLDTKTIQINKYGAVTQY